MYIRDLYNNTSFTNNMPMTQEKMNDRQEALKYNLRYWAQDVALLSALTLIGKHSKPWTQVVKETVSGGILYGSCVSIASVVSNNLSDYGKNAKEKYSTFNLTTEDKLKNLGILTGVSMAAMTCVELLSRNIKEAGKELKLYLPIIAGIGGLGMLWNAYKGCKKENENN